MKLCEKWLHLKEEIKKKTEELHETEASIWLEAERLGELNPEGSRTFESGEFKITITHNNTYKVNQEQAAKNPALFKVKYEFSKTDYKVLADAHKKIVDEAITITPNKPSFRVERV